MPVPVSGRRPGALPEKGKETREGLSGACGDNLSWTLDEDGLLTVTGDGAMWDWEEGASPWYDLRESVQALQLPEGLTHIGDYAFPEFNRITALVITEGVIDVGICAFSRCQSLTSVEFPQSLTEIGDYAFSGLTGLTEISFGGTAAAWPSLDNQVEIF